MKLLSFLIFIYISSLFISYSSETFNADYLLDKTLNNQLNELKNDNSTDNSTNPLQECINKYKNLNICEALLYMAPSYFALVIREIFNNDDALKQTLRNSSCLIKYFNESNVEAITNLVKYSSKSFPDFGDEEGCLAQNKSNAFFLFSIDYYHNQANSTSYTGKFKLLPFISKGYSFFGLCVENSDECTTQLNATLMDAFKGEQINGLNQSIIKSFFRNQTKFEKEDIEDRNSVSLYFLIFIIYIVFRIAVWIFGYYFFKEKNENTSKKKDDDDSSSEEEEEEDEEDQSNSQKKKKSLKFQKKIFIQNCIIFIKYVQFRKALRI